jgi:hypothetical protein
MVVVAVAVSMAVVAAEAISQEVAGTFPAAEGT